MITTSNIRVFTYTPLQYYFPQQIRHHSPTDTYPGGVLVNSKLLAILFCKEGAGK